MENEFPAGSIVRTTLHGYVFVKEYHGEKVSIVKLNGAKLLVQHDDLRLPETIQQQLLLEYHRIAPNLAMHGIILSVGTLIRKIDEPSSLAMILRNEGGRLNIAEYGKKQLGQWLIGDILVVPYFTITEENQKSWIRLLRREMDLPEDAP